MLLHLSEDEEQQVRDFSKLFGEQGFPAQKQKLHISVTFSSAMSNHAVQGAAELLPPRVHKSSLFLWGIYCRWVV